MKMPLYTYLSTYRGASYIAQARRSNFHGFVDWIRDMPSGALPELTRTNLRGMDAVANRKNVWRKSVVVEGSELVVIAVQTVG